jgi:hypothetical protein
MLTQNQFNRTNQLMQNRVFNYKGGLISDGDITIDIDYKVRLLGYKKLISIGEWRDFVRVEVEFIKYNNAMSKKIFGDLFTIENLPYYFKNKIDREITDFLTIFDDDINVVIDNFIIPKEQETLTEGKMSRIAVREIVRDVIKKVKEKKKGFFYLPDNENEVYSFSNLPFEVSLELTLKLDRKMEGYKTTGFYSPEDDVIEMIIIFNPNNIEKHMYELVGEVNEIIAHELEHAYQEYYGEFDRDYEDEIEVPYEYYTQEHEIPAQYKGFRRLSRLRKEPLLMTAKNWFKTHKDIHGLSDEEIEKVIEKIMNYKP